MICLLPIRLHYTRQLFFLGVRGGALVYASDVMLAHFRKVSATEEVKDDLSLHELTQAVSSISSYLPKYNDIFTCNVTST